MINYVTVKRFAELSGYTEKAVRSKISKNVFKLGKQYSYAPDGKPLINLDGFESWVENTATCELSLKVAFKSRSHMKRKGAENGSTCSPPPLI